MLAGLMKYSGAASKVKAMKARLMNAENYRELADMPDLSAAYAYLCRREEYKGLLPDDIKSLPRGHLEVLLSISMYRDFASLYRFITGREREFLENYFCKIEIAMLKHVVKGILDNEEREMDLSMFQDFFDRHTCLDVAAMSKAKSLEEFMATIAATPYYGVLERVMRRGATLFDIEMSLDLYYFRRMWRVNSVKLGKKDRRLVEKVLGTETDLMNLIWIFRVKRFYDVPNEIIYSYVIPVHYRLSKDEIKMLVSSEGVEQYIENVNKTEYKGFFDDVRDNPTGIIRKYWKTVYDINRRTEQLNKFSVAPVLAYMRFKEIENRNVITAVEAIHYSISGQAVMQRLII